MDQVSGFFGGFALTLNSETPPAKYSKEWQSGELGARIFFFHTSREVLLEPNLRSLAVVGRVSVYAGRFNGDFQISDPSSTPSFPQLFWICSSPGTGTSSACWCPWWWARSGWRPGLFPPSHLSWSHKRVNRSSRSITFVDFHLSSQKKFAYWSLHSS